MANDYTTSTDAFADIVEANYSSSDYPAMAGFVTAASRLIDREVGRWDGFFYPSSDDKTDYYDGSGGTEQEVSEYASITSVSVSEQGGVDSTSYTLWSSTEYYTFPYNATNRGKPIFKLIIDVVNGSKSAWFSYRKAVKVVGIPGYSTTPPDIVKLACRMQAVRFFMRAKQGYQDTGASIDLGSLKFTKKVELDPDVRQLLSGLKLELDR